MSNRFVIVGCGSAKRDRELEPGTLRLKRYPARELYTSTYFAKKREYAETVGDQWMILSAGHGMLPPGTEIAPYDTTIDDLTADQLDGLAAHVQDTLHEWIHWDEAPDRIDVLAGTRYIGRIRERGAFGVGAQVRFPLQEHDLGGIGEQMGWLKDQVEGQQQTQLLTDGGLAVGSFEDLEPDRGQFVDRNASMPCEICRESFAWQDYWKDRILSADCDHRDAELWCDDCTEEIQSLRRRLSKNSRITEWNSRSVGAATEHGGGDE